MEALKNITDQDVRSGTLERMLNQAGIYNVQQYVHEFHHETEEMIIEDLKQREDSQQDTESDEIIPAADVSSWLARSRPILEHSMETMTVEKEAKPIEEKKGPTDLSALMHKLSPNANPSSTTTVDESDTQSRVTGDLNTWLTDWSRNLTHQTPTSLDSWLQSLTPSSFDQSLGQKTNSKTRVDAYLNAAEKVLSKHGYKVSNPSQPIAIQPKKTGVLNNVKDMYFLWRFIDKNNDQKITVEDFELFLAEMGLNFLSKPLAHALFNMVDTNHDGKIQFRDLIALIGIVKELISAM